MKPSGGEPTLQFSTELRGTSSQSAAHSLARSSSSRRNRASSPGTIHASACSVWATYSISDTTAIRFDAALRLMDS